MPSARTWSAVLTGADARLVEFGAEVRNGRPGMIVTGLPETALRETRDRVRAAIVNSGLSWPDKTVAVSLAPASLPKRGAMLDTAIAVSVLAAAGQVPDVACEGVFLFAELGLDGRLRPVRGVLPAVSAASMAGLRAAVVAAGNAAEAALVPGITVLGTENLTQVIAWLRNGAPAQATGTAGPGHRSAVAARSAEITAPADLGKPGDASCLYGQPQARRAAQICAAGGHHLSLLGPPGTPAGAVAAYVRDLLPRLDPQSALEVTTISSLAGTLNPDAPLVARPPFVAPHHTASRAAIVGGGTGTIRPGAASLAHRGVLFLDQAPEFARDSLDALRQPLESGQITLARSGLTATFPARFTLVLAANPCPCAKAAGPSGGCTCSPSARRRYLARLSGPLLDRVDVKIELLPVGRKELLNDKGFAEPSHAVAARVAAARNRTDARLADTPWRVNAEVPAAELRRSWPPAPGALAVVERALERGQITARGVTKIVRVAWTIADLTGQPRPGRDECDTALTLWLGATP